MRLETPAIAESPSGGRVTIVPPWYNALSQARLARERLRAHGYRILGAKIGPKCLFGAGIRIDYPWGVEVGARGRIEADVWFKLVSPAARVVVGEYGFLGRGVEIDVLDRVILGAHVLVAPGVFITDHSHNIAPSLRIDDQGCTSGPVTIGNDVWLGARAIVLAGVTIGAGAVVGAGALVREDVAGATVVAGVPARVLRRR
jgi:acetyltransferase-like isoleucine patch superfamily enzyme